MTSPILGTEPWYVRWMDLFLAAPMKYQALALALVLFYLAGLCLLGARVVRGLWWLRFALAARLA